MKYESTILKRLIDTYGVVGNPRYISEIIKEFIVQGKECYPNLFTYQSDWLAHIDEFGLNPSYTVSYTGQSFYAPNTLEKPVKSAILKGNTSVNIIGDSHPHRHTHIVEFYIPNVEPNTDYLISYNSVSADSSVTYLAVGFLSERGGWSNNNEFAPLSGKFILNSGATPFYFRLNGITENAKLTVTNLMVIEYQQGMENWDIPYFEGMQSVKTPVLTTTGKNLWNEKDWSKGLTSSTGVVQTGGTYDGFRYNNELISVNGYDKIYCRTFAELDGVSGYSYRVAEYDLNKTFLRMISSNSPYHTPSNDCKYIRVHFDLRYNPNQTVPTDDIPTYGVVATEPITSYEPYKTNILTVNEDVELPGIVDVQDTLDCLTGEVTQKVGEFIINENTYFIRYADVEGFNTSAYYTSVPSEFIQNTTNFICNSLPKTSALSIQPNMSPVDKDGICINGGNVKFRISNEKGSTIEDLKTYLQSNPIKLIIPLKENSIKTVDLTILDQNEQNVQQLMTFNGGTHFNTTSSEGSLLPVVSVSVETDLEEVLMMCSLEGNTL